MSLLIFFLCLKLVASYWWGTTTTTSLIVVVTIITSNTVIVLQIFLILLRCRNIVALVMIFFALFLISSLISLRALSGTSGAITIVMADNLSLRSLILPTLVLILLLRRCHLNLLLLLLLLSSSLLIPSLREWGYFFLQLFITSGCNGPQIILNFMFGINKFLQTLLNCISNLVWVWEHRTHPVQNN